MNLTVRRYHIPQLREHTAAHDESHPARRPSSRVAGIDLYTPMDSHRTEIFGAVGPRLGDEGVLVEIGRRVSHQRGKPDMQRAAYLPGRADREAVLVLEDLEEIMVRAFRGLVPEPKEPEDINPRGPGAHQYVGARVLEPEIAGEVGPERARRSRVPDPEEEPPRVGILTKVEIVQDRSTADEEPEVRAVAQPRIEPPEVAPVAWRSAYAIVGIGRAVWTPVDRGAVSAGNHRIRRGIVDLGGAAACIIDHGVGLVTSPGTVRSDDPQLGTASVALHMHTIPSLAEIKTDLGGLAALEAAMEERVGVSLFRFALPDTQVHGAIAVPAR